MRRSLPLALAFFFLTIALPAFAQTKQKIQIGVSLTPELVSDGNGLITGYGLTFDYNFNNNFGIESGAFRRLYKRTFAVTSGTDFFRVNMQDYHISVPVMFRYNNKILNIAAGPSFDIYTGYKQTSNTDIYTLKYKSRGRFNLGGQGKISKSVWLSKNLVFEPEGRIGMVFPTERAYLGLGLTVKYGIE